MKQTLKAKDKARWVSDALARMDEITKQHDALYEEECKLEALYLDEYCPYKKGDIIKHSEHNGYYWKVLDTYASKKHTSRCSTLNWALRVTLCLKSGAPSKKKWNNRFYEHCGAKSLILVTRTSS